MDEKLTNLKIIKAKILQYVFTLEQGDKVEKTNSLNTLTAFNSFSPSKNLIPLPFFSPAVLEIMVALIHSDPLGRDFYEVCTFNASPAAVGH